MRRRMFYKHFSQIRIARFNFYIAGKNNYFKYWKYYTIYGKKRKKHLSMKIETIVENLSFLNSKFSCLWM